MHVVMKGDNKIGLAIQYKGPIYTPNSGDEVVMEPPPAISGPIIIHTNWTSK